MRKCPKCNSDTIVVDSCTNSKDQETYRKRVCIHCTHEFYTVETEVENCETLKNAWESAKESENAENL